MAGPIVGMILKAAIPEIINAIRANPNVKPDAIMRAVEAKAINAVMADPVAVNSLNAEPLRQSGTMWGGGISSVGALAVIFSEIATYQTGRDLSAVNWGILVPALIAMFGGVFTIVRRVGDWEPLTMFGLLGRK